MDIDSTLLLSTVTEPSAAADAAPWWIPGARFFGYAEARLWPFANLVALREHRSKAVAAWARRKLVEAVPPFESGQLFELLNDAEPMVSTWAATQLGVASSFEPAIADEAGAAIHRKLLGASGATAGAYAEALGWACHVPGIETLARWSARDCDSAALPGIRGALSRIPEGREVLLSQLRDAQLRPLFSSLATALLAHHRAEDIAVVVEKGRALGIQVDAPPMLDLMSIAADGRGLDHELEVRSGRDWGILDPEMTAALTAFGMRARADRVPVAELAQSLESAGVSGFVEELEQVCRALAGPGPVGADACCLEVVERLRSMSRPGGRQGARSNADSAMVRLGLGIAWAAARRRRVEAALEVAAGPSALCDGLLAAGDEAPPELVRRILDLPVEGLLPLLSALGEGTTLNGARWIAVVMARRSLDPAVTGLLRHLDGCGESAGQQLVVWTALGTFGDATVDAANELYMKSELRTKGLEVIAAAVAGTSKSSELIGRVRSLEGISSVSQGALLAHLGAPDGLERIGRDFQEHNAEALLQPIELLTELHGASSDVLTRARKLAGISGADCSATDLGVRGDENTNKTSRTKRAVPLRKRAEVQALLPA